ncbi:DUF2141 domain-containing protein [Polaribacter litorisediminis]|uniref:DUF2141 domain-containing protein n=1 Tax=Polaribacter litorisediminis TaxID=1908341 RepID=UPI001CC10141|nr:DUF2141 domain-containing protein [Polaribacter litorisediminis]UAM98546.1 DUF2141 domain-containing protein [Polaribacter litorisediminis]
MKNLVLTIIFILTGFFSIQAQEETFTLTVHISGLNSNKGNLMVGVYKSSESFLKNTFQGVTVPISDKKSVATFKNLPKGEYAVSFVHDENENKKMDTNFIGIPKEDYGCSNNATGFMGPPKYEDAKFQLEANKTIDIKI